PGSATPDALDDPAEESAALGDPPRSEVSGRGLCGHCLLYALPLRANARIVEALSLMLRASILDLRSSQWRCVICSGKTLKAVAVDGVFDAMRCSKIAAAAWFRAAGTAWLAQVHAVVGQHAEVEEDKLSGVGARCGGEVEGDVIMRLAVVPAAALQAAQARLQIVDAKGMAKEITRDGGMAPLLVEATECLAWRMVE
ncbi:hypothetical protein CYMTET_36273, partial [Cymbomonas tetramitiformis]